MKKIHVDTSMGIHMQNGIVHIILGSDDLSQKFYKENDINEGNTKATSIISMPILGFIETLNIFQNFAKEPHIKMILDSYADVGVLKKDK
ncbi:hypothetical protein [Sulfurimonas sp.]|uniref:hypothetical protein n=1 Tax=Sulfurimonas sp. TaxID=2022749 RepID=UPI002B45BAFA|nr:hypothetical protein [Sulfurimonas sp.]